MKEQFAKILKELRAENNYTQTQMAKMLNISHVAYLHCEQGKTEPSINSICQLCYIFDVTSDYLLGLEDETGAKIKNAIYDNHGNITFNQH